MQKNFDFPSFDDTLPELNLFINRLVREYEPGNITTWDELETKTWLFFTHEMMDLMDEKAPGWRRMSYFSDGVTLIHVMCVFLGLYTLPEFKVLTSEQQQLAKWIVLFHDVAKEARQGQRDLVHGFRGATITARRLPDLGFSVLDDHAKHIDSWSAFTDDAIIKPDGSKDYIQDNSKLPKILSEIDDMFGLNTPAALIVKCVLLHMSITVVAEWPQSAPLTDDEIEKYIGAEMLPLLEVMNLSDGEGWTKFYPDVCMAQREEILQVFAGIKKARV